MLPTLRKIIVVGGNGFIGSAVCRTALRHGFQVTSISSSGRPFQTPKGHTPTWTEKVEWLRADALRPDTYSHLLPDASAVVHTIGTLLVDTRYKDALRKQDLAGAASIFLQQLTGAGGNPLEETPDEYKRLNRDSAVQVAEAFVNSADNTGMEQPRPFIYISAEDIFQPLVPSAYIETKREAEEHIDRMMEGKTNNFRGVYMRPSLVYHPHLRPYTAALAALFDLSSTIQSKFPTGVPTPSELLHGVSKTLVGKASALDSVARAFSLPPIHVDHVAEAICVAADAKRVEVRGKYGVREMQDLIA